MNSNIFKSPFFSLAFLVGLLLLSNQAVLARKKKNDPRFEARKKQGVAQLQKLIRQNEENTQKGLSYKNWYIFGDPVRMVGKSVLLNPQYGMFTQAQINRINEKLQTFNQAQKQKDQVTFYVYLTGFKVPLVSKAKKIEIKDFANSDKDYQALYEELNNQRKQISLEETRQYESQLLKAIFNEGVENPARTAIYGQTVFLKASLDAQDKLQYGLRNFTGMVLGNELIKTKKADLWEASKRLRGIASLPDESSAAYYLRVNVQAAIDGLNGVKNDNPDNLEKYSAAWFAQMTSPTRNSEQWNKDIVAARKILQESIQRNQSIAFRQRKQGEHNFERRYIVGKYRTDRLEGGPVLSLESYTILNDKMMLLEEKTGVRYYVLYYEVDYYIPKEDKTQKRDRAHFKQAVLQGMETSLNEQTVVLMVPFFRALAEVKEKGKMTTKLKSFGFPQLHKGGSLPEALQQTFSQYQKGDVYNLALGLYRDIPKPHYVYAQYFRADGAILYTKVEEPKKVAGYKDIYEFHFYLDHNLKEIKKLQGTRRSQDLIEDLKKGPPNFQRVVHKIREYAIPEGHLTFSYNYVYKDYSALMDYMRGVARPKGNLPKEAFIIPPKEADLIENVLDFSSFFLSFVGLDIVPEAIGFVYNAARDNDQGKLKYLAGIALVGPSGFMNKISWRSIKSFVKGLGGYTGLRKKFSASIAGQLDNKFLKKIDLDDAFRKDEDLLKKLDEDLVANPSLIKEFNQKPELLDAWYLIQKDGPVDAHRNIGEIKKVQDNFAEVKRIGYKQWKNLNSSTDIFSVFTNEQIKSLEPVVNEAIRVIKKRKIEHIFNDPSKVEQALERINRGQGIFPIGDLVELPAKSYLRKDLKPNEDVFLNVHIRCYDKNNNTIGGSLREVDALRFDKSSNKITEGITMKIDDRTKKISAGISADRKTLRLITGLPSNTKELRDFISTNKIGLNERQVSKVESVKIVFEELASGKIKKLSLSDFKSYFEKDFSADLFKIGAVTPKTLGTTKEDLLKGCVILIQKKL